MKLAKEYSKKLEKIKGIITPKIHDNRKHIFHLYSIKIDKEFHLSRDELFKKLYKKGIGTSVQYIPLHLLTHFKKKYNEKKDHFPNSNILKNQVLCLPIYPDMTMKQLDYVVACLTK